MMLDSSSHRLYSTASYSFCGPVMDAFSPARAKWPIVIIINNLSQNMKKLSICICLLPVYTYDMMQDLNSQYQAEELKKILGGGEGGGSRFQIVPSKPQELVFLFINNMIQALKTDSCDLSTIMTKLKRNQI